MEWTTEYSRTHPSSGLIYTIPPQNPGTYSRLRVKRTRSNLEPSNKCTSYRPNPCNENTTGATTRATTELEREYLRVHRESSKPKIRMIRTSKISGAHGSSYAQEPIPHNLTKGLKAMVRDNKITTQDVIENEVILRYG